MQGPVNFIRREPDRVHRRLVGAWTSGDLLQGEGNGREIPQRTLPVVQLLTIVNLQI